MQLKFRKVTVCGPLAHSVDFSKSQAMGHRVSIMMSIDIINQHFTWSRNSGEPGPTGRFTCSPEFTEALAKSLRFEKNDSDGHRPFGLDFGMSEGFVEAYLSWLVFGYSRSIPNSIKYQNVNNADIAKAICETLVNEENWVNTLFHSLLKSEPLRFFNNGKQISGMFETTTTSDYVGNWCLKRGDVIEIPIRIVTEVPDDIVAEVDADANASSTNYTTDVVFRAGDVNVNVIPIRLHLTLS